MMDSKTKFNTELPKFTSPEAKEVIDTVIKILREDLEYSRDMQDRSKYQEERLAWQNHIMHDIDLIDQVKNLYESR